MIASDDQRWSVLKVTALADDHELRLQMPELRNARHELFAQMLVEGKKHGWSNGAAYSRAGYRAEGRAAEVNASRLINANGNGIAARGQEIVGAGAKRAEVTVASLLDELDEVLSGALGEKQYAAARAAIDSKARLKGLFVDRISIEEGGVFSSCRSPEAVVDQLLIDMEPQDLLDLFARMSEMVAARASEQAVMVTPARKTDEAAKALHLFKPGKQH